MKNIPIISKFLMVLGLFGLFVLATTFYATGQMREIGSSYSALLNGDAQAAIDLARGNRALQTVRADIADLAIADTNAEDAAAYSSLTRSTSQFTQFMDSSAGLAPAESAQILALKGRAEQILNVDCAAAIQAANTANTSAAVVASQHMYLSQCQPNFPVLTSAIVAQTQTFQDNITVADAKLATSTSNTITLTFAMIVAGLAAVITGGFFAIRAWVANPIKQMETVMRRLSSGDYKVKITGSDRRDEIGGMAEAVQVFKDAGLEKIRLEGETEAARAQAAAAREAAEAEQARAAAQLETVVTSLAGGLEKLAHGDLLFRLDARFSAEYEKLRDDFNAAMEKLQATMQSIAANTAGVRAGASEINQASDDLSRRTEQQAASLEETAAALDQITATVKRAAESAKEARDLVTTAKTDAERSGEVVREMVGAMSGIETSSRQIGNIIGVIDEIAFQTNLLALNAGVEAARAGDAGRGFAVVATEVRALAQRSAEAAKEIKALISTSGQQVDSGVKLVAETGKALVRIVEQVGKLNQVVSTIAASAQEQATGLNEVNTAVNQMDQVTQRNAAMVEESTAASHALASEAAALSQLVGQFQIGKIEMRQTKPARKMAPPVKSPGLRADRVRGAAAPDRVVAFNRGNAVVAEEFEDAAEF